MQGPLKVKEEDRIMSQRNVTMTMEEESGELQSVRRTQPTIVGLEDGGKSQDKECSSP